MRADVVDSLRMRGALAAPRPGDDRLFRILFVSTANQPLTGPEFRELLCASTQRNKALGITGLLLYANGRFMGTSERPEVMVNEVFRGIQWDYRHKNVDVMVSETVTERLFPDWQFSVQGFAASVDALPAACPFMSPDADTSEFRVSHNDVFRALLAFRKQHVAANRS